MSNLRINNLSETQSVRDTDVVAVDGSVTNTKKFSFQNIWNWIMGKTFTSSHGTRTIPDAIDSLRSLMNSVANGTPTAVTTVSEMTDTSKLYVYAGSETGYTAGDWYYYDGSAWVSGGGYGDFSIDDTLSVQGAAADAKAAGDSISTLIDAVGDLTNLDTEDQSSIVDAINEVNTKAGSASGSGLTEDVKVAILACFEKVAWIDEDGQDYYDALYDALYPPADLSYISAVFTQGSAVIYEGDSLNVLKQYLVVTAHMSDSSTQTVTSYTLSGTLSVGTSTITVSYGGKMTTFTVTVSASIRILGYVKDDILMLIDGIANGESGSHNSTITSLIDQSANGYNWESHNGTVTATSKALAFDGSSSLRPTTWDSMAMPTPNTIEIVLSTNSASTTQCVVCGLALSTDVSNPGTSIGTIGIKAGNLLHYTGSTYGCIPITLGVHTYTFVNDNNVWHGYKDGELVQSFGGTTVSWNTAHKRLGAFVGKTGGVDEYRFSGYIYSLRVYSKALTVEEIVTNRENDVTRFELEA